MTPTERDRMAAGIERRLATVELLIPSAPAWQSRGDIELRPGTIRVVAGPNIGGDRRRDRRSGVLVLVGLALSLAVLVGLLPGLLSWGPMPAATAPATAPSPSSSDRPSPSAQAGTLKPAIEPRLTIPVRPRTGWTITEDTAPLLTLLYPFESTGSLGYSVGLLVVRPHGVYDPANEEVRLPLPADLIGWIRRHPDLDAGEPVSLTVAGRPATAIDVTVTYHSAGPDESPGPKGRTVQFIDIGPGSWNLESPSKKRIVLVDLPDGPLLIVFDSRPEFFDAGIAEFKAELGRIRWEELGPSP